MPVESDQYISACEEAYRDGFAAGQHRGLEATVTGWQDERTQLATKAYQFLTERDQARKDLRVWRWLAIALLAVPAIWGICNLLLAVKP